MLYQWYELGHAVVRPARFAVDASRLLLNNPFIPFNHTAAARHAAAACEVFERTTRRYDKPSFWIASTNVGGQRVPVRERVVWRAPFCRLVHFERQLPLGQSRADPKIFLVAPMSGHYATLLRGTVEAFLPDHEVYITDWENARDVPYAEGRFDFHDYIDHVRTMLPAVGRRGTWSPSASRPPVLAAAALMRPRRRPRPAA